MRKQYECYRCGKLIEYYGKGARLYCPDCRGFLTRVDNLYARATELSRESRDPYYSRLIRYEGRFLDHLDITLLKCKELGMSYAQYQIEWQLAQLPPIGSDPCITPKPK